MSRPIVRSLRWWVALSALVSAAACEFVTPDPDARYPCQRDEDCTELSLQCIDGLCDAPDAGMK